MTPLYNMAAAEAERRDCLDWAPRFVQHAQEALNVHDHHVFVDMAVKNLMVGSHVGRIGT